MLPLPPSNAEAADPLAEYIERGAVHEAGHAVARLALRLPCPGVSIGYLVAWLGAPVPAADAEPPGGPLAHTSTRPGHVLRVVARRWASLEVVAHLAGPLAESARFPGTPGDDPRFAADYWAALGLRPLVGHPSDTPSALVCAGLYAGGALLADVWPGVLAVASALLDGAAQGRYTLGADDVRAVAARAGIAGTRATARATRDAVARVLAHLRDGGSPDLAQLSTPSALDRP